MLWWIFLLYLNSCCLHVCTVMYLYVGIHISVYACILAHVMMCVCLLVVCLCSCVCMLPTYITYKHVCTYACICSMHISLYVCSHVGTGYMAIARCMHAVSHNCFYYTSKPECAILDDNLTASPCGDAASAWQWRLATPVTYHSTCIHVSRCMHVCMHACLRQCWIARCMYSCMYMCLCARSIVIGQCM